MSHYFDDPDVESDEVPVDVVVPGAGFSMLTDRGVFSRGRLDAGTRILLQTAPAPPATGDLLDLGCGAGPVALTMASRSPGATVWAVDVNDRARRLTERNARRNSIGNLTVAAPHDVPGGIRFDAIWSNPPIRIGKHDLHDLLSTWLGRLRPTGVAVLVVHRHLGADSLQRWLDQHGHRTERLASRAGYRVLTVRAAPTSTGR